MIGLTHEQRQDIGLRFILDLLDPSCPYGARLLKDQSFYTSAAKDELERELDNVEIMLSALENSPDRITSVRHALSTLKDISGTIKNCSDGCVLTEVELFELTAFLLRIKELIPLAESLAGYDYMEGTRFRAVDEPLAVLDPRGDGRLSFYIEDSRTPKLFRIRHQKRELERKHRLPRGGRDAAMAGRDGAVADNDGAVADRDAAMAERLAITSDEERELSSIYFAMTEALRPMMPLIEHNAAAAGRLDAAICKALLARRFGAARPAIGCESLAFKDAVNPEVAESLSRDGRLFTPITIELVRGVTILTGANMGGKSVAIKTIMLNTALALMGYFVFCSKGNIPMFDRIELINRDLSSVSSGLSSFGGEIMRFNEAVGRINDGGLSLIAMDEFARGTNSGEGSAIVRGVVEYLDNKNAVTILATHYDGAAEHASRHYQARGLCLSDARPRTLAGSAVSFVAEHMDYSLAEVGKDAPPPRDALEICRLLGMDEEILSTIGGQ